MLLLINIIFPELSHSFKNFGGIGFLENHTYKVILGKRIINGEVIIKQTEMSKSHTCYFHKNKPITSFCTLSQCTLPMCQECLPIHSQEHKNHQDQTAIIPFHRAQEKAISQLKMKVATLAKNKKQCQQALGNTKDKLIQMVNTFIKQQQSALNNMFESLQQTEKKLAKIQKGSLKSLIYFYSNEEKNVHQIQRASLAYREALEDKLTRSQQNFTNCFTTSLYEPNKKEEPEIPTVRQIKAKSTTFERASDNLFSNERKEIQPMPKRDYMRDRESARERTDFSKEHKTYQHRQIFTQKSTDNLELYSKKKYEDENPRESQKYEPAYTRNRIHTQADYRQPSFKTSYEKGEKYKYDEPLKGEDYRREERRRVDQYEHKEQSYNAYNNFYNGKLDFIKVQEQWSKKPLLPSDLNLEYTNSVRLNSSKGKQLKSKLELNKQVLSPEEIRKMLEKRIEERSRIISKTKNMTPSRHEESGHEHDRNWETKDSIINQIYNDYRY